MMIPSQKKTVLSPFMNSILSLAVMVMGFQIP